MVDLNKELWLNLTFFRNYLNANEATRTEYKKLKLKYAELENVQIMEYTDLKEPFVKCIYEKRQN